MRLVSFGNMPINDGVDYSSALTAGGQVPAEVTPELVGRTRAAPVLGAVNRPARYLVVSTHVNPEIGIEQKRLLQRQWYLWFRHGVRRQLVIADDDGGNERYVWAAAFVEEHTSDGDGWEWETMLVVDGDGDPDNAWRSMSATSYAWEITESGDTLEVVNGGELDAYPVISITPEVDDGGEGESDYYTRFVTVRWRAGLPAGRYPVDITDGSLDTRVASTHFADAGGDDIRIYVNGADTDYWLVGPDTDSTSIWANLDFQTPRSATLASALDTSEITTLGASGDISGFPADGVLLIGSELFTYSGKSGQSFTNVARARYGTSAASHSGGAAIEWIQHTILLEYGNLATPAKVTDDRYKPIVDLASSTNTSWVYADFFEEGADRAGAWTFQNLSWAIRYGGNRNTTANPYGEMGVHLPLPTMEGWLPAWWKRGTAHWFLLNPCGITAANFTNCEKYTAYDTHYWQSAIRASGDGVSWSTVYLIPPGTNGTWNSWSHNATSLPAGTRYVSMFLDNYTGGDSAGRTAALETEDVTVTLDSSATPLVAVGPELEPQSRVRGTLENMTTGESLSLSFHGEDGDNTIEIDVDRYTVRRVASGRLAYSAVGTDNLRAYLLRLAPGANVLRYVDEELVRVDLTVAFRARYLV